MEHIKLTYLEVENFKSFENFQKIGPLTTFSIIIGSNGSGKSNILDAISFALGATPKSLRCGTFNDLKHGAAFGKPASGDTSVTVVFEIDDDDDDDGFITEKRFTRTIDVDNWCKYIIDGEIVTADVYREELNDLKLNIKANNFLVYQGKIETLALMKPKDLADYLEVLSGSRQFKPEYNIFKKKADKKQLAHLLLIKEKSALKKALSNARHSSDKADEFLKHSEELENLELELALFRTYFASQAIDKLKEEEDNVKNDIVCLKQTEEEIRTRYQVKVQKFRRVINEVISLEHSLIIRQNEREEITLKLTEKLVNESNVKDKVKNAENNFTAAKNRKKKFEADVMQLEIEKASAIKSLEAEQMKFEAEKNKIFSGYSEEELTEEYNSLRNSISDKPETLELLTRKQLLECKQAETESEISNLKPLLMQNKNCADNKKRELDKTEVEIESLNLSAEEAMQNLLEIETSLQQLKDKIAENTKEEEQCQKCLVEILEELACCKVDKYEYQLKKSQETNIDKLKENIDGVHDRVKHLCKPINDSYKLSVARALGQHMDSIVVETTSTAVECITFLKKNKLKRETFLPLTSLVMHTPKACPTGVSCKPVLDILKFEKPIYEKVISFCIGNIVVCETVEDATKVAYGDQGTCCKAVVKKDGTLYNPGGTICGGQESLERRVRKWDEKIEHDLRRKRDYYTERCNNCRAISRKLNFELQELEKEVEKAKEKSNQAASKLKRWVTLKNQQKHEWEYLKEIQEKSTNRMKHLKALLEEEQQNFADVITQCNADDDEIYKEFCKKIGVKNIRVYKKHLEEVRKKYAENLLALENQKNRAEDICEFEFQQRPVIKENINRWAKEVDKNRAELHKFQTVVEKFRHDQGNIDKELEKLKKIISEKKEESVILERGVEEVKNELHDAGKTVNKSRDELNIIQLKLEEMKLKRIDLLKHFTILGIEIPFIGEAQVADRNSDRDDESEEESLQLINIRNIIERGESIEIDFSQLRKEYRQPMAENEASLLEEMLCTDIETLKVTLAKMDAPNLKARHHVETLRKDFNTASSQCSKVRRELHAIRSRFETVKRKRMNCFQEYFNALQTNIDLVMKGLYENQSAQAFLLPENPEEPYLAGIKYDCIPPGKGFHIMKKLSGGERSMSALVLLYATFRVKAPPLFMVDEVDASLDTVNSALVAHYLKKQSQTVQTIAISLDHTFASYADTLLGTWNLSNEGIIQTQVVVLDMRPCHEDSNMRPDLEDSVHEPLYGGGAGVMQKEKIMDIDADIQIYSDIELSYIQTNSDIELSNIQTNSDIELSDIQTNSDIESEIQRAMESDDSLGNEMFDAELRKEDEALKRQLLSPPHSKNTSYKHTTTSSEDERTFLLPRKVLSGIRNTKEMSQDYSVRKEQELQLEESSSSDDDEYLSQKKRKATVHSKSAEPHPSGVDKISIPQHSSVGGTLYQMQRRQSQNRQSTKRRSLFQNDDNLQHSDSITGVEEFVPSDAESDKSPTSKKHQSSYLKSGQDDPNKSAHYFFKEYKETSPLKSSKGAAMNVFSKNAPTTSGASISNPKHGNENLKSSLMLKSPSSSLIFYPTEPDSDDDSPSGENKGKNVEPRQVTTPTPDVFKGILTREEKQAYIAKKNEERRKIGSPPIIFKGRMRYCRPEPPVLLPSSKLKKRVSTSKPAPFTSSFSEKHPQPNTTKKSQGVKRKAPGKKKTDKSGTSDSDVPIFDNPRSDPEETSGDCLSD